MFNIENIKFLVVLLTYIIGMVWWMGQLSSTLNTNTKAVAELYKIAAANSQARIINTESIKILQEKNLQLFQIQEGNLKLLNDTIKEQAKCAAIHDQFARELNRLLNR